MHVARAGGGDDFVSPFIDNNWIWYFYMILIVDSKDHRYFVDIERPAVDVDAARAQFVGRQLPHANVCFQDIRDDDFCERRNRLLHESAVTIDQTDIL